MGSSQRLAAVAAVSHSRHYYNHTHNDVTQTNLTPHTLNIFFVSATLCGVLVAVCAACWKRAGSTDKPEEVVECRGVYTVSADRRLTQVQIELPGPPPAYETVVEGTAHKDCALHEVISESCPKCEFTSGRPDAGLPSYEAAVLLKDTKL